MPIWFVRLHCHKCGAENDVAGIPNDPQCVFDLKAYKRHGWVHYQGNWFCPNCIPKNAQIIKGKHPRYYSWRDEWEGTHESYVFENEDYDPYLNSLQFHLCQCCNYCQLNFEDDGSTWSTCTVENAAKDRTDYGHNLYAGHFYGSAISGRLCPYFAYEKSWVGRDPRRDYKQGVFHVPFEENYDGD